jgi:hypothetical protein
MGDAIAHLAGADDADLTKWRSRIDRLSAARGLRARPGSIFGAFLNLDHFDSPYTRLYDDLGRHARFRQCLTLSSSAASSGSA